MEISTWQHTVGRKHAERDFQNVTLNNKKLSEDSISLKTPGIE
jgi:hypothetical protein